MAKHELVIGKLQGDTIRKNGEVLGFYYEVTSEDTFTESGTDRIAPWEMQYHGQHRKSFY